MKKNILTIMLAIIVGFLLSKFTYEQYGDIESLELSFGSSSEIYLIRQGIYSSEESMKKNLGAFDNYIYKVNDNKYYVYIGITGNMENATKLKGFFGDNGYDTYMETLVINNKEFINLLEQYDLLLSNAVTDDIIEVIINQVLNKYKELVLDGKD